jgi:hypothetical protein
MDVRLLDALDELISEVELYLDRTVKVDDPDTFYRLRSIPGVGKILGLVLLYEIHDNGRFAGEGEFEGSGRSQTEFENERTKRSLGTRAKTARLPR